MSHCGTKSWIELVYCDTFIWTSPSLICTGAANAPEHYATTFLVTCLGPVRAVCILCNRNGVCTPDLQMADYNKVIIKVYLYSTVPSVWLENGRGVALHQTVCWIQPAYVQSAHGLTFSVYIVNKYCFPPRSNTFCVCFSEINTYYVHLLVVGMCIHLARTATICIHAGAVICTHVFGWVASYILCKHHACIFLGTNT